MCTPCSYKKHRWFVFKQRRFGSAKKTNHVKPFSPMVSSNVLLLKHGLCKNKTRLKLVRIYKRFKTVPNLIAW